MSKYCTRAAKGKARPSRQHVPALYRYRVENRGPEEERELRELTDALRKGPYRYCIPPFPGPRRRRRPPAA
jgi:hypothetical protein